MPTEAKRATVAELAAAFAESDRVIVSDYRGLTVSNIGTVRRSLREKGITYRVVKNRLARIAADQAGREALSSLLEGPSALALGGADEVALARGVLDALRPFRTVAIRGAVVGGTRLDAESVGRLATLPSREQMFSSIAGGFAAPLATTAALFDAPLRELAGLFEALTQKQQAA
jgi:large subunit ribosomal protein L10